MLNTKLLYDLQEADLGLDKYLFSIKEVDTRLKDDATLIAARTYEMGRNQETQRIVNRLREEELETDGLNTKIAALDKRLYSGIVKQPRELEDLEVELKSLKVHSTRLEERTLASMMELEEARAELQQAKGTLDEVEQEWLTRKSDLATRRESLLGDLSSLRNRRDELSKGIEKSYLSIYDRIRSSHRGQAVAKVERNTCHGCRITLPTREVQRARTSNDLVFCGSCGRILHVT